MEEENLCSPLPDPTQPEPDSWTSMDYQFVNGEQQGVAWEETQVQVELNSADKLSPKAGRDSPEEADLWEPLIWPTRPLTCTSPPLSFATVQWDMPDPSAETPSLVTHGGIANEPYFVSVTSVRSTSSSPHPSEDTIDELFTQEQGEEEEDGFDSQSLIGNKSVPCDAADLQEATTQEESTQELSGCESETPLKTHDEEKEEENGQFGSSDPVEILDLTESLEEIQGSEDDSFVALKLKEEPEEPDDSLTSKKDSEEEQISVEEPYVLLTTQGDLDEEQTSVNGVEVEVENEKGGEVEEEESVTTAFCHEESEEAEAECRLSDVEVPPEVRQTDNTGSTIHPDNQLYPEQLDLFEERRSSGTKEDIEAAGQLQESIPGQSEEEKEIEEQLPEGITEEEKKIGEPLPESTKGQTEEEIEVVERFCESSTGATEEEIEVVERSPGSTTRQTEEEIEVGECLPESTTGQTEEEIEVGERLPESTTGQTEEEIEVGERLPESTTGQTEEEIEVGERLPESTTGQTEEEIEVGERLPESTTGQTEEEIEVGECLPESTTGQTEEEIEVGERLPESTTGQTEEEIEVGEHLPESTTGQTEEEIEIGERLPESTTGQTEEEIEALELFNEGPTVETDKLEMYKDVDANMNPEESEAADNIEDTSKQVADNAENLKDSQEVLEQTGNLLEISCSQSQDFDQTTLDVGTVPQAEHTESKQLEMTEEIQVEEQNSKEQVGQCVEQSEIEMTEEESQTKSANLSEESAHTKQEVCIEAEDPEAAEEQEETKQTEMNGQQTAGEQLLQPEDNGNLEETEKLSSETEATQEAAEVKEEKQAEMLHQVKDEEGGEDETLQTVVGNGIQPMPTEAAVPRMNGREVDREKARCLAERLFKLDGIQRVEVVRHLDKDNDFSRAAGEEYLKFFDFAGQTLDHALRSFLKVVVLIGETQERERVLQHFACRFHQCNPDSFSSSGSVLALTCALMLLNTDLHGQNIGKCMSSSKFVCNLDGMNEGENFSKDLLKSLYNSIKNEPLEWAIDEEELKGSVLLDEDAGEDALLRSKANPFQDLPHNKRANIVKQAFLQRKLHADIDGKRTPWGKRGWKTFCGVLRGMVLYLQKDDYRKDHMISEEAVSVHHSLAEPAADYTKKPHVFRLQTADWRVFLFQASSKVEMHSWISRINLVSALHSSPPFPAAVGSQRRFCRPILPASQSAHTLESQLQSHGKMLESFKADLAYLQENPPDGKKAKAKELEENRVRAEYLQHEMCRYETYIQVLEAWKSVKKTDDSVFSGADLSALDKALCADSTLGGEEEEEGLKRSHSSPSLELEVPTPAVIKVRRNISERRTYRKTIIPRWNKET